MRLRKRHAWSAVLIALFALPVLKPEGVPAIEGFFDPVLSWPARASALNPHDWLSKSGGASDDSPRAQDLHEILLAQREEEFRYREEVAQQKDLVNFFSATALDRRPTARHANVLRAHDASPFRKSISIDRGVSDGVREGNPVVTGRVFLGTIQSAQAHFARAMLVTDTASRLWAAVVTQEGARAEGALRGGGDPARLRLRFARTHEGMTVRVGDPVTTSNYDEKVPAGLLVGTVAEVGDADGDGLLEVFVRPQMDLERSTTVMVLEGAR